ncbi:hypothetical protein GTP81_10415 [Rugamonas sp. FT107W]|uniref:Uncharacterized protein n=1 Tax=Duganella vulcania TaxID=2692166 RepID=A0A845HHW3_9BURK|nr:hypothetical protein [Duganella vulcania]MYN17165.1 hypothetical protein [Duganella vulcania]
MAFFKNSKGINYFSCFYLCDELNAVSGIFYELPEKTARRLFVIYRIISVAVVVMFFVEILLPIALRGVGGEEREIGMVAFLVVDSLIILPPALLIIAKKKVAVRREYFTLNRLESIRVYICVCFVPLNYTLIMIWIALVDTASSLLPFAVAMSAAAISGGLFRLRQIARMET